MKKGITIVAITTAVVLMAIFTSVTVISAKKIIENANKYKFVAELINIQDLLSRYKDQKGEYPAKEKLEVNLSTISETALNQFRGEEIEDNKVILYTLEYSSINLKETIFGNNKTENDKYAFSKTTGKVYYLKAIEYKGKKYYTVHEEILEDVTFEYKLKSNEVKKLDVVFSTFYFNHNKKPSILIPLTESEYTKYPIRVHVRIPANANFTEVSVPEGLTVETQREMVGGYETIVINHKNANGNYKIFVEYSIKNTTKYVWYIVDRYDGVSPQIIVGDIINIADEQGMEKEYITGVNITDKLSGIKEVKYEYDIVEDYKYFENHGIILNDDKIDVTGKSVCSIYAIDNAGNQVIETVSLD